MSTLLSIIQRDRMPQPWAEGDKIPWNEPGFSRRMLREHLTQDHDAASRRTGTIERHVDFIHTTLLKGRPGRVLDLGCGPGLYSNRLARLGHTCFGIDFSPASIGYARETAAAEGLACTYREADLRTAEFEPEVDTALFLFGECNVFRPAELRDILARAAQALKPGGHLLLEPSTPEAITRIGQQPATWSAHNEGLFSDRPHLLLHEAFWDEAQRVSTDRYFVVDADTGVVTRHAASQCAHLPEELIALLHAVGFTAVERVPAWDAGRSFSGDFLALVASR
ncbi:MAG TPA: class I SAM-dependent methyltransferase [Anaerolineales bacterium]|nr:class I SAM-dependent methyltransferase [Anaerolineales bacterium]